MLFAKWRDWTPRFADNGYELGFAEHDDGDVVKWDWTIYKFAELKTYDDHDFVHHMYEEVCSLDVSPMNVMNTLSIGCSYNKSQNSLTMTLNNDRMKSKMREEMVCSDGVRNT